jgi:hypothetical protein
MELRKSLKERIPDFWIVERCEAVKAKRAVSDDKGVD